jgi:hypothetical protein
MRGFGRGIVREGREMRDGRDPRECAAASRAKCLPRIAQSRQFLRKRRFSASLLRFEHTRNRRKNGRQFSTARRGFLPAVAEGSQPNRGVCGTNMAHVGHARNRAPGGTRRETAAGEAGGVARCHLRGDVLDFGKSLGGLIARKRAMPRAGGRLDSPGESPASAQAGAQQTYRDLDRIGWTDVAAALAAPPFT